MPSMASASPCVPLGTLEIVRGQTMGSTSDAAGLRETLGFHRLPRELGKKQLGTLPCSLSVRSPVCYFKTPGLVS